MGLVQFIYPAISKIILIYFGQAERIHFKQHSAARLMRGVTQCLAKCELHLNGSSEIGAKFELDKSHLDHPLI